MTLGEKDDQAEIGEFWSFKNDEQLALEEKERESKIISKARKSDAVGRVGEKSQRKKYNGACSGRIDKVRKKY